jgi:Putative zinc-finger
MITDIKSHEEYSLLLPWLANGRLSARERLRVEEHVHSCEACGRELAWQRLVAQALNEPDRVTYAPGPSFRKLLARIDSASEDVDHAQNAVRRARRLRSWARAAWRPPGLAWAASFVLLAGASLLAATAYRWSQPLYTTHTAPVTGSPNVLHIAFEPSLSIGEAEQVLRSAGARVVEGPGTSGIFGVTPAAPAPERSQVTREVSPQMRALAERLRADARVRWVEPIESSASSSGGGAPEG